MDFFGFQIKRKKDVVIDSVVPPPIDDGSTLVGTQAGYYAQTLNTDTQITTENDLLKKYRDISSYTEVDAAIEDIVNEAVVYDDKEKVVQLNLEELKLSDSIKKKFNDEFDNVLSLLGFNTKGHDVFRSWYVDGRIYYQVLIDEINTKQGIQELRYIDSRKIRKVKEVKKDKNKKTGIEVITDVEEYYIYNEKGINNNTTQGVKLGVDSVVSANSGLLDLEKNIILSHLHLTVVITI